MAFGADTIFVIDKSGVNVRFARVGPSWGIITMPISGVSEMTDARRSSMPREQVKMTNQSNVFNVMKVIGAPATIADISRHVGGITERTVRRAIDGLVKSGHVIEAGKNEGAALYALREQMPLSKTESRMVPFGSGSLLSVEDFLDLMTSIETNPLRKATKRPLLSDEMSNAIRQRMAFVIMTAGEPGFANAVNTYRNGLITIQQELMHVLTMVKAFVESPVWYDHYRDQLATSVRDMQKDNPELFQLAKDYIANLANKES